MDDRGIKKEGPEITKKGDPLIEAAERTVPDISGTALAGDDFRNERKSDWDPSIDLIDSVMANMKAEDRGILLAIIESKYAPLRVMARDIHEHAKKQGFWNVPPETRIPQALALIHSEVSEALEEARNLEFVPNLIYQAGGGGKPVGFPIELADIVIRVMDLAEALGIDLNRAIRIKHNFNLTRPRMHGRRF